MTQCVVCRKHFTSSAGTLVCFDCVKQDRQFDLCSEACADEHADKHRRSAALLLKMPCSKKVM